VKLVLATHNLHKLDEIRVIVAGSDLELVTLGEIGFVDDPPETSDTFVGNALQKARYVRDRIGGVVAADDSGLEVDALGGAPGVHSKRFSVEQTAEANNRLLLARLGDEPHRAARFRCVLAVVGPGGERTADGVCEGTIGHAPRGAEGFGYDPLFLPHETPGRTMAELTMDEKNAISHRGRAFRDLAALARQVRGGG
jgi:XTP/dITP diphosphohydrolase